MSNVKVEPAISKNMDTRYKDIEQNPTFNKALDFSIRIVSLYQLLKSKRNEKVMSKQMLRSGTSIGANYSEAIAAESDNDFIHKCGIALKEANETKYWILLLYKTNYINEQEYKSLIQDCQDLRNIIGAIINTKRKNLSSDSLL